MIADPTPPGQAPPSGGHAARGKAIMPVLRAVTTNGRNTPEANFQYPTPDQIITALDELQLASEEVTRLDESLQQYE